MILGYALSNRERVTCCQLREVKRRLLDFNDGYILDVSFRTIAKTVRVYSDMMDIVFNEEEFSVVKKKRKSGGRMFQLSHLRQCYSASFDTAEFAAIVKILQRI